jgi:hypothetical protein
MKVAAMPAENPRSKSEREFIRMASLCTALSFGCVAALMESSSYGASGFTFQVSARSLLAFAAGALVGWFYWWLVAQNKKATRAASWVLGLGAVATFLYPLRFIPRERRPEIALGLVLAAGALSLVAFFMFRIKRFLESDARNR